MAPRTFLGVVACLLLALTHSYGELKLGSADRITDLKTQLPGTAWKVPPNGKLRPGLTAMLTFTDKTVGPAGYRYEVNTANSFTLFFNHGDKQVFRLSPDGRRLKFTFKNGDYAYDLVVAQDVSLFAIPLPGTTWKANGKIRPGLGGLLAFTPMTVESAGYRYEVNSPDSFTLFFNHGDTQVFRLSPDHHHLNFTFKNEEFTYDLAFTGPPDLSAFAIPLAGTKWKAAPNAPLRPGLVDTLTFTEGTIGPAGYLFLVNGADALTLYFDYGDNQPMSLQGGRRLAFEWKGKSYAYDLLP